MKPVSLSSILFVIIMILLVLLPVATGVLGFIEDDELVDEDDFFTADSLIVAWARMSIHQMLPGLVFGMSVFTLFVVYLGGRNNRRFNDRTIAANNSLGGSLFATALLIRAVFVFLTTVSFTIHAKRQLNICLIPTIISVPKEVR
jgi:hypothetical protein